MSKNNAVSFLTIVTNAHGQLDLELGWSPMKRSCPTAARVAAVEEAVHGIQTALAAAKAKWAEEDQLLGAIPSLVEWLVDGIERAENPLYAFHCNRTTRDGFMRLELTSYASTRDAATAAWYSAVDRELPLAMAALSNPAVEAALAASEARCALEVVEAAKAATTATHNGMSATTYLRKGMCPEFKTANARGHRSSIVRMAQWAMQVGEWYTARGGEKEVLKAHRPAWDLYRKFKELGAL